MAVTGRGATVRELVNRYYPDAANPVKPVQLPKKVREPEETYAYSLEEVLAMMVALPEPTATMVASIAFTGVRRGDLRGFKWENYRDGNLAVKESNRTATSQTRRTSGVLPSSNIWPPGSLPYGRVRGIRSVVPFSRT
jgi:integrase